MATIVDPRALPERPVTIPGLKPPVRDFAPSDNADAREVDEFNCMIRRLRDQGPIAPEGDRKPSR